MKFSHQQTFVNENNFSKSVVPLGSVNQRNPLANSETDTPAQPPVVSSGRRFNKRKQIRRLNRNKVRLHCELVEKSYYYIRLKEIEQ